MHSQPSSLSDLCAPCRLIDFSSGAPQPNTIKASLFRFLYIVTKMCHNRHINQKCNKPEPKTISSAITRSPIFLTEGIMFIVCCVVMASRTVHRPCASKGMCIIVGPCGWHALILYRFRQLHAKLSSTCAPLEIWLQIQMMKFNIWMRPFRFLTLGV